jgi:uncharacterized protein (DUF58 family)
MRSAAGTLALGVAILTAGFLLDGEPLLAAGAGLVFLAGGAMLWVAVASGGATIEREVGERRIVEDEPLAVRIAVHAPGPWPGGEVRDELLPEPASLRPGRRRARIHIQARFARRGMRDLPAPLLVLRDPLGLASREVRGGGDAQVLVLPRTFPVRGADGGSGAERATGVKALLAGAALTEFDGLAPYREGAPAARIHWPALARGAGLLERRLRPDADARPLVVLDARAPHDEEALDAAVRAAASLCLALGRGGGCAALLPGERRPRTLEPDLAAWPSLHAKLALVGPGPSPAFGAFGTRTGPVFYVAARALARPPAAAARASAGRLALVVPAALAGRAPSFSVAGCHGYPARESGRVAA